MPYVSPAHRRTYGINRRGVHVPLRQPLAARLHPVVTVPHVPSATARRTTSPPLAHADRLGRRLDSVPVGDRPVTGGLPAEDNAVSVRRKPHRFILPLPPATDQSAATGCVWRTPRDGCILPGGGDQATTTRRRERPSPAIEGSLGQATDGRAEPRLRLDSGPGTAPCRGNRIRDLEVQAPQHRRPRGRGHKQPP